MKAIEDIIGEREADNLREDFWEMLGNEDASYANVEDLLLGYGLEMDYVEQLMW